MTSIHLPFSLALLAVPALLALATALLRPSARRQSPVPEAVNHRVRLLVMGAFLCAGAALWLAAGTPATPHPLLQPALLAPVMLALTAGLGWVIVRFSRHYMAGDAAEARHLQGLLMTLTSVSLLVISNHAFLFLAAWVAVSLSLHRLLLLYPERPRAALAAHKKFIAARTAELALLEGRPAQDYHRALQAMVRAQQDSKLIHWYGEEGAEKIERADAFEICEYGAQPTEETLRKLFPFFPARSE